MFARIVWVTTAGERMQLTTSGETETKCEESLRQMAWLAAERAPATRKAIAKS